MSRAFSLAELERQAGLPFIERGLGRNAGRHKGIAFAITAAVALLNGVYYAWLSSLPRWRLDLDDERFLADGLDAVAGALDLQLVVLLGVGLLLVAPTLACQTVIKEAESRTLDALLITPLPARGVHNGFTFGALARLAPWLAPALLFHLALGMLPCMEWSTTFWTTSLLLVGGVAMTSLGTMAGLLLRDYVRGPLAGLVIFVAFGAMVGLPILALGESNAEWLSAVSPLGASVHTMLVDDHNVWLRGLEAGPLAWYPAPWLGLPLHVPTLGLILSGFWWALSSHIGRRKLEDATMPAMSWRASMASMAFVAMVMSALFGPEFARGLQWVADEPSSLGRQIAIPVAMILMFTTPLFVLWAMATGSNRSELRRFFVGRATEGRAWASPVGNGQLVVLGLIPLAVGLAFPFLCFGLDTSLSGASFGDPIVALIPVLWALATLVPTVGLWRLSEQKGWQTALAIGFGWGVCVVMGAYIVTIVDHTGRLRFADLTWDGHGLGAWLGLLLLAGLVALPVALISVYLKQRTELLHELSVVVRGCMPQLEVAPLQTGWPESCEEDVQVGSPIWLSPVPTDEGLQVPSGFDAAHGTPATWVGLEGATLRYGEAGGELIAIELTRPFTIDVTRAPVGRGSSLGNHTLIGVALTQSSSPGEVTRIGFAFVLPSEHVHPDLPVQVRGFGVLPAVDVQPLLARLRFFAEVHGQRLPRLMLASTPEAQGATA